MKSGLFYFGIGVVFLIAFVANFLSIDGALASQYEPQITIGDVALPDVSVPEYVSEKSLPLRVLPVAPYPGLAAEQFTNGVQDIAAAADRAAREFLANVIARADQFAADFSASSGSRAGLTSQTINKVRVTTLRAALADVIAPQITVGEVVVPDLSIPQFLTEPFAPRNAVIAAAPRVAAEDNSNITLLDRAREAIVRLIAGRQLNVRFAQTATTTPQAPAAAPVAARVETGNIPTTVLPTMVRVPKFVSETSFRAVPPPVAPAPREVVVVERHAIPSSGDLAPVAANLSAQIGGIAQALAALAEQRTSDRSELLKMISDTNNIGRLPSVTLSAPTISGTVSGLTDASIPDDITINTSGTINSSAASGTSTLAANFAAGTTTISGVIRVNGTGATSTFAANVDVNGNLRVGGACISCGGVSSIAGWTDSGILVELQTTSDLVVIGTSTPVSGAVVTVEATTTGAIPLALRGYTGQAADFFRILNASGQRLMFVSSTGGIFSSSTLQAATTTIYGNLGVGTTSPAEQLSVAGRLYVGGTGTSTIENNLQVLGQLKIGTSSAYITDTQISGTSNFTISTQGENNHLVLQTLGRIGVVSTTPWGVFSVEHNGANQDMPVFVIADEGTSTPTFVVDWAGKIMAGTSTPRGWFTINDRGGADTFVVGSNTPRFIVKGGGNVGVGTSSPYALFSVGGNAALGTTTLYGSLTLGSASDDPAGPTNGQLYYSTTDGAIRAYTNSTWGPLGGGFTRNSSTGIISLFNASDRLTIGTTSPAGLSLITAEATSTAAIPLTLRGYTAQAANLLQIVNSSDTNLLFVNATGGLFASSTLQVTGNSLLYGSLGIATTSPSATFAVQGNALISGNVTSVAGITATGTVTAANLAASASSTIDGLYVRNATTTFATTTMLVVTDLASTSRFTVSSAFTSTVAGTSTFAGAISTAGLASSNGLTLSGGALFASSALGIFQYLGVGTTSPAMALGVQGNELISGNLTVAGITATGTLNVTGLASFNGNASTTQITSTGSAYLATTGGNVGIGTSTPYYKLTVEGGSIFHVASSSPVVVGTVASTTAMSAAAGVFVVGNYAYVTGSTADTLNIIDVSSSTAPQLIGSILSDTQLDNARGVYVSGKYAYVAAFNDDALTIVDVSNPSKPVIVGSTGTVTASLDGASEVYVSGRYAYVAAANVDMLTVVDVSNPTTPTIVGSVTDTLLNGANSVQVSGKYAYVGGGFNGSLVVVDISRPESPLIVGSVTDNTTALRGIAAVFVSGRYAYTYATTTSTFSAIDISNPESPAVASSLTDTTNLLGSGTAKPSNIFISGTYAYVTSTGADKLNVIDISNPSNLRIINTVSSDTQLDTALGIYVSGKYAYVAGFTDAMLAVVDLNGLETPAITTGNIKTGALNVSENLNVGGEIYAGGGLNVGISGIFSRGGIAVHVASTSATNPVAGIFMGGNVGIGTTTPGALLSIHGNALVSNNLSVAGITATGTVTAANLAVSASSTIDGLYVRLATTTYATTTDLVVTGRLLANTASSTITNLTTTNATATVLTISSIASTSALIVSNNLGIGTTTPTQQLSVAGRLYVGGSGTSTIENNLLVQGTLQTGTGSIFLGANFINFNQASTLNFGAAATTTILGAANALAFATSTGAVPILSLNGTSGNVGIGVASPSTNLDVRSSSPTTNAAIQAATADANRYFKIESGTDSVEAKFSFRNGSGLSFIDDWDGLTVLTFDGSQNVGIHDTTPDADFEVSADASTSGAIFMLSSNDDSDGDLLTVRESGNVGVGTTSPGLRFSVHGNALVSNNLSVANLTATGTVTAANLAASASSTIDGLYVRNATTTYATTTDLVVTGRLLANTASSTITNLTTTNATATVLTVSDIASTSRLVVSSNSATSTFTWGIQANALNITGTATSTFASNIDITTGCFSVNGTCVGSGSGSGTVNSGTAGYLTFYSSTGTTVDDNWSVYFDNTTGRLGIGTTTPAAPLHIATTTRAQLILTDTAGGTNAKHRYASSTGGAFTLGLLNDALSTYSEHLRITSTGEVGIGTTSPYARLSITGASGSTQPLFVVASSSNATEYFSISSTGTTTIQTLQTGAMTFETNAGAVTWVDLPVNSSADQQTTESYSAQLDTNDVLTIYGESDGSGGVWRPSVGIGSSTPWGIFSIEHGSIPTSSPVFVIADQGTSSPSFVVMNTNGFVGVATATPGSRFSVHGNVLVSNNLSVANLTATGTVTTANLAASASSTIDGLYVRLATTTYATTTDLVVTGRLLANTASSTITNLTTTNATATVLIVSNTLGVGTTSPWGQFSIEQRVGIGPVFAVGDEGTSSPHLVVAGNGYVGIGTSSPWSALSIEGRCVDTGDGCADFAELYTSSESVMPGEIVSADAAAVATVRKARLGDAVIGIVSSAPAITIEGSSLQFLSGVNYRHQSKRPAIALSGRVPVKVSTEGGAIRVGDRIALSSISGVGMRATTSGVTVGVAIEAFDGGMSLTTDVVNDKEVRLGSVTVFVNLSYASLGESTRAASLENTAPTASSNAQADNSSLLAQALTVVKDWLASVGVVIEQSVIKVKEIIVDVLMAKKAVVDQLQMKDKFTGDVYCVEIVNGDLVRTKGECVEPVTTVNSIPTPDQSASFVDVATTTPEISPTDETATTTAETATTTPEINPTGETGPIEESATSTPEAATTTATSTELIL